MKLYRLKHIPSGLYFRPSRMIGIKEPGMRYGTHVKSNLSETGKIYAIKPSFKYVDRIWNHTILTWTENTFHGTRCPHPTLELYQPQNWVIEEIQ